MKTIPVTALTFLLLAGCATGPQQSESTDPTQEINDAWLRNREAYYRGNGWSAVDASLQAAQDLDAGKSPPADRPPTEHMVRD